MREDVLVARQPVHTDHEVTLACRCAQVRHEASDYFDYTHQSALDKNTDTAHRYSTRTQHTDTACHRIASTGRHVINTDTVRGTVPVCAWRIKPFNKYTMVKIKPESRIPVPVPVPAGPTEASGCPEKEKKKNRIGPKIKQSDCNHQTSVQ